MLTGQDWACKPSGGWHAADTTGAHLDKGEPQDVVGDAVEPQRLEVLAVSAVAGVKATAAHQDTTMGKTPAHTVTCNSRKPASAQQFLGKLEHVLTALTFVPTRL